MKHSTMIRAILCLFVILGLSACRPATTPRPPDEVTVQLKWVHQAQFAGFYLAEERGYYADENLSVTFVEGGPGISATEEVAEGRADFGVDAPENILVERSEGQPVVAIATIFRRSPLMFISPAESDITRPQDVIGKRVAILGAADAEITFEAMMRSLGLDLGQVELISYSYDLSEFKAGEVDVTYAYSIGGALRLAQEGVEVHKIWPNDYGVHMYSDTLLTHEDLIGQNPDLATRFLRATLRGWRAAIEEPEAAVNATMQYAREANVDLQTEMMAATIPIVHTGRDQIGWMEEDVWRGMHEILLSQDILKGPVDLNAVYTLRFLNEIYEQTP